MFDFKSSPIKDSCDNCTYDFSKLKFDALFVCSTCLNKSKTLVSSIYGDICKPCHKSFFTPRHICGNCKELKRRTFHYKNSPIDAPLCPECYYKLVGHANYTTCRGCRRYRELQDGQYCKACLKGVVSCKVCGNETFAGRESECEKCSGKRLILTCAKFAKLALPEGQLRTDYMEFMEYLTNPRIVHTVYSQKQYPKYLQFFIDCKNIWGEIPDYKTLVSHYKPNGLRAYLRVLRWLVASNRIEEDLSLKKYYSESERIITLKSKIADPPFELTQYFEFLENKLKDGAKISTIRANMQPAVDMCVFNNLHRGEVIEVKHFDKYLKHHPGQKHLIWQFATFLKNNFGRQIQLSVTDGKVKPRTRSQVLVAEKILTLLFNKPTKLTLREEREWFRCSMWLCHKHWVKKDPKVIDTRELIKASPDGQFECWRFNGQDFWLPKIPTKNS